MRPERFTARRRIVVIQGHPDGQARHFCHALADAYAEAAAANGHEVRRVEIARLDFPYLRSAADWEGSVPLELNEAQENILWANHLVFVFPLWLGTMPALLKGFLEQILRPGFGFARSTGKDTSWRRGLIGKSARLIVTMGMPAFLYRWYFLAHGVKGMERNILRFCGIAPVRETFIGMVEESQKRRVRALERTRALGHEGN